MSTGREVKKTEMSAQTCVVMKYNIYSNYIYVHVFYISLTNATTSQSENAKKIWETT